MDFEPKTLKLLILLDLMDVYQCHPSKKKSTKIPSTTLVFKKYTSNFSCYVISIIFSSIYIYIEREIPYTQVFQSLLFKKQRIY
jgi:hypothetical protein